MAEMDAQRGRETITRLLQKGVRMPNPETVTVDEAVNPDRISGRDVVIHPGCRVRGADTLIMPGARLGTEGPVTVEDAWIGPEVELAGGYFREAVFLKGAKMGDGAHVRGGTLLEESAGGAHTVGLKQTILFPFVTLGSLINFCDVLMAGGTSRRDHSEVGSAYIHFNFTPNGDKATPSLLGDVPNGVMLNQRPIFLGGQGGLVGPCRLAFGTVTAAGTVWRKDELRPNRLLMDGGRRSGSLPYTPGVNANVRKIVDNNAAYIGHLAALIRWYEEVRPIFGGDDLPDILLAGARKQLRVAVEERLKRLGAFCRSAAANPALTEEWPEAESRLREAVNREGETALRDPFLGAVTALIARNGRDYLTGIQGLAPETAETGVKWLQTVVDGVLAEARGKLPSVFGKTDG